MPKAIKPVANLDALLEATADLESGHSIEAVLAQHGIPARHSAYKELEPVIKAIAKHLEEQHHD
jgi:hypothetical protein